MKQMHNVYIIMIYIKKKESKKKKKLLNIFLCLKKMHAFLPSHKYNWGTYYDSV